jgi:hypothetical protein
MSAPTKSRHDAARTAARARWGEPRVIRLDGLSPDARRLILALVAMAKAPDVEKAA